MELPVPEHINYISEPFSINRLSKAKKEKLIIALEILREKKIEKRCCIAGGFAAYLVNRTNLYNDIDIYEENLNYHSNIIKYNFLSTYVPYKGEKINEITVRESVGNYEYFVFSILKSFDINTCRVGIYINEQDNLRLIKFPQNALDLAYADLTRLHKYTNRLVDKTTYNPKKLSLCAYIQLYKQHTTLKACIQF